MKKFVASELNEKVQPQPKKKKKKVFHLVH